MVIRPGERAEVLRAEALAHEHHGERRRDQERRAEHQREHRDRERRLVDRDPAEHHDARREGRGRRPDRAEPVAGKTRRDDAGKAGQAHQREQIAGGQRAEPAILRERRHMRGDEEIVEAADRVDRKQQPELARARGLAQRQARAAPRRLARPPCPGNASSSGSSSEMRDADPDEHRAPADLHQHAREQRDHHELPDAHAGDRDRVGEPRAARIDAHHDHADDHQRGHAVADREYHAIESERVPRLRHEAHQADAGAADDGAADQQRARAQPIGQAARDESRDRRDQHVGADGQAQLAARPAELVDHRLEGEPDRKARAAANEEDEKAGGERECGAHVSISPSP